MGCGVFALFDLDRGLLVILPSVSWVVLFAIKAHGSIRFLKMMVCLM